MQKFLIFFTLFLFAFSFAGTNVVCRAPQNLQVNKVYNGAQLSWEFQTPDSVISYNDGKPLGLWGPELHHALGVVFDLSAYPQATMAQIDFAHGSRGALAGPYLYSIHIFDMDSMTTIAVIDSLVAGDAKDIARFEVGVDIGNLPVRNRVGIFIEGHTVFVDGTKNYTFPALMSDSSVYIAQTNYYCLNVNDPWLESDPDYTNIWEPVEMGITDATNFVMDLWLNLPQGKLAVNSANQQVPRSLSKTTRTALTADEFIIRRALSSDSVFQEIGRVPGYQMEFLDTDVQVGKNYLYGVSTVCDQSVSDPRQVTYSHLPTFSVHEARLDENGDGIPDRLDQDVFVTGLVTSPNFDTNTDYFIQDNLGGLRLKSAEFMVDLQPGDSVFVEGVVQQINGTTTIVPQGADRVQVLSSGNLLDTLSISIADVSESYEGMLVIFTGQVLNAQDWPAEGQSSTLVQVGYGGDTLNLDINQQTDLDGWAPPQGNQKITGIVEQFSNMGPTAGEYFLRVRSQSDFVTLTGIDRDESHTLANFKLFQNYPNPFNPSTKIRYRLGVPGRVKLTIHNCLGQKLRTLVDQKQAAGLYNVVFEATDLASGIYYYKFSDDNITELRKMVLLK